LSRYFLHNIDQSLNLQLLAIEQFYPVIAEKMMRNLY